MQWMIRYLNEAGIAGWATMGSAVVLLILAVERLSFLYLKVKKLSDEEVAEIGRKILVKDYSSVLQISGQADNIPQLQIIKTALLSVDSGREAMKSALGAAIVRITKSCEKRIPIIALIASVATLLGLLGTISGLITTFASIAAADPAEKAAKLGAGISEAMTSTEAGLIVGVIAMVVHTFCTTKIEEIVGTSQETAFNVVAMIERSERGQ